MSHLQQQAQANLYCSGNIEDRIQTEVRDAAIAGHAHLRHFPRSVGLHGHGTAEHHKSGGDGGRFLYYYRYYRNWDGMSYRLLFCTRDHIHAVNYARIDNPRVKGDYGVRSNFQRIFQFSVLGVKKRLEAYRGGADLGQSCDMMPIYNYPPSNIIRLIRYEKVTLQQERWLQLRKESPVGSSPTPAGPHSRLQEYQLLYEK
jgi:hypothetical protein